MFDAKFKLAAASLIRAALVEDFDTAELIISQHDPYELTRAMAVISAQGWTINQRVQHGQGGGVPGRACVSVRGGGRH
jgi:hypothetical protein